jgi:AcrR family transcriptional regulator
MAVAMVLEAGRTNQKWRTRKALVEAAAQLMRAGQMPSVAEVADAARVSRTTAYRYFPTQEHLLSEGVLQDATKAEIERLAALMDSPGTPEHHIDVLVRGYHAWMTRLKPAARAVLRASLQAGAADGTHNTPRRPAYAVPIVTYALAPLQAQLGAKRFSRLVSALVVCVSIEGCVALEDICGLDDNAAEDVKRWAARTLIRGAVEERAMGGGKESALENAAAEKKPDHRRQRGATIA